jgi:hypothetical protein
MAAAQTPAPAQLTDRGVLVSLAAVQARLGGAANLRRAVVLPCTVTAKPARGAPPGAPVRRLAYGLDRPRDVLRLPRAFAARLAGTTIRGARLLEVAAGEAAPVRAVDPDSRVPAMRLYGYQATVADHLCDGPLRLAPGPGYPDAAGVAYLQMDTGMGKTMTTAAVIARLGVPALVVVPTKAMAEQWCGDLRAGYPGLRAARFENAARVPATPGDYDVVVVVINTFRAKTPEFLRGYGLVVLDEAHELTSRCGADALWLAQAPRVLGLSATPDENPNQLGRLVHLHLGPPIRAADVPGFDATDVDFRGAVTAVHYSGHPDRCQPIVSASGTASAPLIVSSLAGDPRRNAMLAARILALLAMHARPDAPAFGLGVNPARPDAPPRRHGVFVFAENRAHLITLRDAILRQDGGARILAPELDGEPDPADPADPPGAPVPAPVSVLRGGVAAGAVGEARAAGAHAVLTTYGYSRRGISLPEMTCIVFATPRRNGMTQVLGRIVRRGSDESIRRLVVDVVDVCTALRGQHSTRRQAYAAKGWPVTKEAVRWEDVPYDEPDAEGPPPNPLADLTDAELRGIAAGVGI